jgi:hypothetical protein
MKFIYLTLIGIISIFNVSIIAYAQNQGGALQNRTFENNSRFGLPDDIKSKLDSFFVSMQKKEYKSGLEKLLINSPISKKDTDFTNILKQLSKAIDLYGDIKGYEIVDYKLAGSSFYKINIMGLHQKYPTRWEVYFYRSPELGLIITNIRFDDISEMYLD